MGTRAVIQIDRYFIATHWDGYPSSLGKALYESDRTLGSVLDIARAHTIDAVSKQLLIPVLEERFEHIIDKAKVHGVTLTKEYLYKLYKEGKCVTFGITSADDYPILPFSMYGDFPEYVYKVYKDRILFSTYRGEWDPRKLKKLRFTELKPDLIENG